MKKKHVWKLKIRKRKEERCIYQNKDEVKQITWNEYESR